MAEKSIGAGLSLRGSDKMEILMASYLRRMIFDS